MSTQKNKPTAQSHYDEAIQDRLIPFPAVANATNAVAVKVAKDPLWSMLSHHPRNPFVRFLRTVFFYEDGGALSVTRDRALTGRHYFHGKPLAH